MNASVTSNTAATPDREDLSKQIEALRADLTKLAATLSDDVAEGIGNAGRHIGQTGRDARATATNTVTEHPLAAVGIAMGLGLLLGMVARKG